MKRKWTQSMTMHLNGGSKFSSLIYKVLCDGKPTNIQRARETNGSPQYLITADEFLCGGDVYDMLARKGEGLEEWLEAHHADEVSKV